MDVPMIIFAIFILFFLMIILSSRIFIKIDSKRKIKKIEDEQKYFVLKYGILEDLNE